MMIVSLEAYRTRMRRVLEHIDRNPESRLDLDALSAVAAFSKFHFHRQFTAIFGMSVHCYVLSVRLKRAAYRLAYREGRITDIALEAGYGSPDAFARAFRRHFRQSPSSFRRTPDWDALRAVSALFDKTRMDLMECRFTPADVTIREVAATPVAIMVHRGDPSGIGATVQRFIAWRRASGLPPWRTPTFNIFHTDPQVTPPEAFRLDLCVGTAGPIPARGEQIEHGFIPAGRCAVLRVHGDEEAQKAGMLYLYRDWLPASGEETRDFPPYCQRIALYPDVAGHEAVTELFLPLAEAG
ncbi:AraC family transcriptional regulator [Swaminathania salitolerans]|nr:AraC family transcriptional regulator [Swaminathania salitolerans]